MQTLTITQPDDWHVHLRDGAVLTHTVPATAQHFGRALVMPNLKPALTTVEALINYRARILAAHGQNYFFNPLMTLYLNETVTAAELMLAKKNPFIVGAKFYPAGATTQPVASRHPDRDCRDRHPDAAAGVGIRLARQASRGGAVMSARAKLCKSKI